MVSLVWSSRLAPHLTVGWARLKSSMRRLLNDLVREIPNLVAAWSLEVGSLDATLSALESARSLAEDLNLRQ